MKNLNEMNTQERGSALLVTLMVVVGLSLLGLGFVSISETESGISVNHRNSLQVQSTAEAGVNAVVEWFQSPTWADDQGLLPANVAAITPDRVVTAASYNGKYKPNTADQLLFDKPFKPAASNRFWGTTGSPDVLINATTLAAAGGGMANYLTKLNQALFDDNNHGGSITEIKVYAPPMLGGTISGGYWQGGTRLGVATIEVTASKCRSGISCTSATAADDVLAQKTVRAVVTEWPFPGPSGPIQTNAQLNTNGSLQVHWGKITATENLDFKSKNIPSLLPYHDAYTIVDFQRGYVNNALAATNDPWPTDPASSDFKQTEDWLYELVTRQIDDPWWNAWTRLDWGGDGAGGSYQVHKYDDPTIDVTDNSTPASVFQFQSTNDAPERRSVLFPNIEYAFWKQIATSADNIDSVTYLRWISGNIYEDAAGTQKSFLNWVDVSAGAKAGFYFFDTMDQTEPTDTNGDGVADNLTPAIKISGVGGSQMQGFIYINTVKWDASGGGSGGPTGWYATPGEPYKDIGYWEVDTTTMDWALDGGGNKITKGSGDGEWSFQDVDGDNVFDLVTEQRNVVSDEAGNLSNIWFPATWYPGCTIGTNCSEPHEPYLNIQYSTDPYGPHTIGWQSGVGSQRPTRTTNDKSSGTPVNCATDPDDCTSNKYDLDGGLVQLEPFLNGVLYIEGQFEQTGNMHYFGSVLVEGDASKAGTPDIWFDERLIKGQWPPADFNFPRVYVSAIQIDQ